MTSTMPDVSKQENENVQQQKNNKRQINCAAGAAVSTHRTDGGTSSSSIAAVVDPATKRQRVLTTRTSNSTYSSNDTTRSTSLSLLTDLHEECTLSVLAFLHHTDLNIFGQCSKEACRLRSHHTLDQTREVELRPRHHVNSVYQLIRTLARMSDQGRFGERQKHFKIDCHFLTDMEVNSMTIVKKFYSPRKGRLMSPLNYVTTLDLSASPLHNRGNCSERIKVTVFKALALAMPNLTSLDMSGAQVTQTAAESFSKSCHNLECFKWDNCSDSVHVTGQDLGTSKHLKELSFENACFYDGNDDHDRPVPLLVFQNQTLVRVNVKGATVHTGYNKDQNIRLTQETLAAFVIRCPTLRWIKSDLTPVTIAQLGRQDVIYE